MHSARLVRVSSFRIRYQSQHKTNLQNDLRRAEAFNGTGHTGEASMRGRWSLAIDRRDSDPGRRAAGLSDPDLRRHPDRGCPLHGRQGQHHERPALHPAQCHRARRRPPASSRSTATSIRARPRTALRSNSPAAAMWCSPSTRPATVTAIRPPSPTALAAPTGWRICAASTSSTRTISASRAIRWAAGPCSPPPPRCPTTTSRWCWRDPRPANRSPPKAPRAGRATSRWCSRNTRNSPP